MKTESKQQGILLIHGILGSPREMEPVQACLKAAGHQSRIVTLPGHGTNPEKMLRELSSQDMIEHCLEEYQRFSKTVDEVFVVGHSLGGICTLLTASYQPEKLKGVVVFSTPYEYTYLYTHPHLYLKAPIPEIVSGLRYAPESYTGFEVPKLSPIVIPKLVKEAFYILGHLRERLPLVTSPVCLAHSRYDLSIPYTEMDKLAQNLKNAPLIQTCTFDQSGHQIFPVSQDMHQACQLVLDFIQRGHLQVQ